MTQPESQPPEMKRMSLLEAKGFHDVCALKYDSGYVDDYWFTCDGRTVSFAHQKLGKKAEAIVSIPLPVFRRFLSKLTKKQMVKERP